MSKTEKLLSILKSECEYPKPLSVNAPLVAEIILVMRRLSAENAELRARLDAIYSTEPVAWEYMPSKVYDDKKLTSDSELIDMAKTWARNVVPLIPLPEKS
jgi:hypothetical protein